MSNFLNRKISILFFGLLFIIFSCNPNRNESIKVIEQNDNWDIISDTFSIKVTLDMGDDDGCFLGTLFELYNSDNELISAAGFNNAINTRLTTNSKMISFFYKNKNSDKPIIDKIENPFPNQEFWNRTFSFNDTLYSFSNISDNIFLKKYNAENSKWFNADFLLPKKRNDKLIDAININNKLLWVYEKVIYYEKKKIFELNEQHFSIKGMGFNNGSFFIYVYSSDNKFNNQIYYGNIEYNTEVPSFKIDTIFNGLCKTPNTCNIFGWMPLGNSFLISTSFGHIYKLNQNGLSFYFEKQNTDESWQLYGFITIGDSIWSGHYPSGSIYILKNDSCKEFSPKIPLPNNASDKYREAQTIALYNGEVICGLWPWGEIWSYNFSEHKWKWIFRPFIYPDINAEDAPFVSKIDSVWGVYNNQWGQRILEMLPLSRYLYINTGSKDFITSDNKKFLDENEIEQYGKIYRLFLPGQISTHIEWKQYTELEFIKGKDYLKILQDGIEKEYIKLDFDEKSKLRIKKFKGIYGDLKLKIKTFEIN